MKKCSIQVSIKTAALKEDNYYNESIRYTVRVRNRAGIRRVTGEVICGDVAVYTWTKTYKGNRISSAVTIRSINQKSLQIRRSMLTGSSDGSRIQIRITAVDKSGTVTTQSWYPGENSYLKLDCTAPEVGVTYDTTNSSGFYKTARTAKITIADSSLDLSDTKVYLYSENGSEKQDITDDVDWISSGTAAAEGTYAVQEEGDDYFIAVVTTDLAGNTTRYTDADIFTVDTTDPVMEVTFDSDTAQNGRYYNSARTATVTVTEHNFDPDGFQEAVTAVQDGRDVAAGSLSGWTSDGDVHTATLTFSKDADYTLRLDYTDPAGNKAETYTAEAFTIDTDGPVISWEGVEDGGVYTTEDTDLSPQVSITDANCRRSGITVTIEGCKSNNAKTRLSDSTASGNTITFRNGLIASDPEYDDIYTMRVEAVDLAGNQTTEEIQFLVNRSGSTFYIEGDTKDLAQESGYMTEAACIEIHESCLEAPESYAVVCTLDGNTTTLVEGVDYVCSDAGLDRVFGMREYVYTVSADYFTQEGEYSFRVRSADRAGNKSQSSSDAHGGLAVDFIYDATPPVIDTGNALASGGIYAEDAYTFDVVITDAASNIVSFVVKAGDEEITYIDTESTKSEAVTVTIPRTDGRQTIQLIAEDAAGNSTMVTDAYTFTGVIVGANGTGRLPDAARLPVMIAIPAAGILFLSGFLRIFRRMRT